MGKAARPTTADPAPRQDRRNPDSHEAILDATLDLVQEIGYARLTIEGIAAKAGVGKSTIYRWWKSKGELVIEALADVLEAQPLRATGDTRTDLMAIVNQAIALYSDETGARTIIAGLVGDIHHDPDLATALRASFIHPRRAGNREVITAAIERGDLPADTDIELLIDTLVAPISYRALITDDPIPPSIATALVDRILGLTSDRRAQPGVVS
jgi:AcrR family transcriptional regulator